MFECIKLDRKLNKKEFKDQEATLRAELLHIQQALKLSTTPVIVLVTGLEGAGKGEVVNRLNKWLDPRGVQVFAFWDETDEERERPHYWRYWRAMPPRGDIAVLFGGWYLPLIEQRFANRCTDSELEAKLNRVVDFEQMLTQDGALLVKFWFHMSENTQKQRLKALRRDDRSKWKMRPGKKLCANNYALFEQIAERVIRHTDRGIAPWYLIEATDQYYRDITVGRTLLNAIQMRLNIPPPVTPQDVTHVPSLPEGQTARITILDQVDLSQDLTEKAYKTQFATLERRANLLAWQAYKNKRSTVMVFEGWDAAGKGGTIRRYTQAIDARLYRSIAIGAPTDEERAQHYLWRFWRHIPRAGYITIYDRSWYGRVLVERVEGFAQVTEWHRAYAEINQFEAQLAESGVILLKFWLHISYAEQLRRFQERTQIPYKQHKITQEDWRNREHWEDYLLAVNEMTARTSTEYAPWHLVPGNDKHYARILVLNTICDTMELALSIDSATK